MNKQDRPFEEIAIELFNDIIYNQNEIAKFLAKQSDEINLNLTRGYWNKEKQIKQKGSDMK